MFIDPHVHSKEISRCSKLSVEEIVDNKKALGYDGAILTNHCQPWYYESKEHSEEIKKYIEVYEKGRLYGKEKGFNLMLGIEVTLTVPSYADWLLYGLTEDILLKSPCLYEFNQEQLYAFCKENGLVLVQAHPFREPIQPQNPKYMDGVEINCHPFHGDLPRKEKVVEFAKKNSLIITCGVDYHEAIMSVRAGMIVPDGIETARDFGQYLKGGKTVVKIEDEIETYEK